MSQQITVSSTTDTLADVTAAVNAGKDSAAAETQPETAGEPEAPEEEEQEQGDEEEVEESEPVKPSEKKPKGGFQRKIDKLTREKHEYAGRVQSLERMLEGRTSVQPPAEAPQPQTGKPQEANYQTYEAYIEALTDWKVDQREQKRAAAEEQRRAAESHRQLVSGYEERAAAFREQVDDYDDVLAAVEDVGLAPVLVQALMDSEHGPQLAYELARNRKELVRIAKLTPIAAIRELGKLEAKLSAPETKHALSKAPEPIKPVAGRSAPGSSKPPDQMNFQEYKKWRLKNGAR